MANAPRPEKPLLAVLSGHRVDPPPVWLMRQAGRYLEEYREIRKRTRDFLELCYTPDLAVEVTLQPLRRFALDAAILFSDILVVPHALGAEIEFVEGEGPCVRPVRDASDLARLDLAHLHERLAPVYETVRRLRSAVPEKVALIGFAGAPWTLAAYLVEGRGSKEFLEPRLLARRDPNLFARMIDLLTEAVTEFLSAQVEAGAEALQLFDSWAGVLPEAELRRWCLDPARRIVSILRRRHPEVPIILFPRGVGASLKLFASEGGAQALSLDTSVPMAWAAAEVYGPGCTALQGNLDPVALLGPEPDLLAEARSILRAGASRPHIFNLGHGVLPMTAPERVQALVRYLKSGDV